ncbi:hypothetical protein, partial [Endozoicomonas atrinae]|uniref:hypothetical protein n=1 Tax=Endozoicomonas atrinae TaxID=1333660 RepID=UPI001112CC71
MPDLKVTISFTANRIDVHVSDITNFTHQPVFIDDEPVTFSLFHRDIIPIAFSKSLSCRQLCLGIITMHYLEQMSRRPQLPEGFNDVDF